MCLKCHLGLSDEMISSQLQEQLDKDTNDYPKYNSTSISHFIIAASGYNGLDVRNNAITLLNKYNEWLTSNPKYILHQSLSPQHLIPMIEKIKNNQINHKTTDSVEKYLKIINE